MRHGIVATVVLLVGLSVASWLVGGPGMERAARVDSAAPGDVLPELTTAGFAPTADDESAVAPSVPPLPDHLVSVAPLSALLPETISPPPTTVAVASPTAEPVLAPPPAAAPAPVAAPVSGDGASFLADLNALRSGQGVSPLARNAELDSLAQSWAETMAADGSLRHSELIYDVIAGVWTSAGENIGYGPSATAIFDGLKASPGHLDNMVNPAYTSVGIGTVRADGVLWTAHIFAG